MSLAFGDARVHQSFISAAAREQNTQQPDTSILYCYYFTTIANASYRRQLD